VTTFLADAAAVLAALRAQPWHHFWPDDIPFDGEHLRAVIGHRQVTDAYLAALARHRGGQVATMDNGLAAVQGDVAVLLP